MPWNQDDSMPKPCSLLAVRQDANMPPQPWTGSDWKDHQWEDNEWKDSHLELRSPLRAQHVMKASFKHTPTMP